MEESKADIFSLSPMDESFPVKLLQEVFDCRMAESKAITTQIYNDIIKKTRNTGFIPAVGTEKMRLVVDVSDDTLREYADGAIKLAREKGHLVAQIKNNGRYGRKLPIKEETYMDGADMLDVQNALQLQAIQQALGSISEQIQTLDQNVKDVLRGQQNDRLGLFYSGVAIYIEADRVKDVSLKNQLMAQAIKTLSDSIFQITLTLQSDVAYLKRSEYDKDKKNKFNLLNEKMDNINSSFMAIHQATLMKSAIYGQQGELQAMAAVLGEYERFIKGTIVNNAEMLSQCDTRDTGKQTGVWKSRANLQLEVDKAIKALQANTMVLYLEEKGESKNESI